MTYTSEADAARPSPGTLGAVPPTRSSSRLLLQENGVKRGPTELPARPDGAALDGARQAGPPRAVAAWHRQVTIPPAPPRTNPLDQPPPVTDAMLPSPPMASGCRGAAPTTRRVSVR